MKLLLLPALAAMIGAASPAAAQMADMPGMAMPAQPEPAKTPAPAETPAPQPADPHAGHDMTEMADMAQTDAEVAGEEAANQPAPPPPRDHAADALFNPAEMAQSRAAMADEMGSASYHKVMFNLAEVQVRNGVDSYRWDAEAWFGGDLNRLVIKSEGRGDFAGNTGEAEVQALYSRAIGPYFNLQGGVRYDFRPSPSRGYVTIGIEGLAPYMFEVGGALFVSDRGDVLARAEGSYDQRITQRLILQPRVELNFAAQDMPETGVGAGLSDAELGLRLRYEIKREFAPYVGISYDAKTGKSAQFARAAGEQVSSVSLVIGLRTWF